MNLESLESLRIIDRGLQFRDEALNTVQVMYKQYGQGHVKQLSRIWNQHGPQVPSFLKNRLLAAGGAAFVAYKLIKGRRDIQQVEGESQTTVINNYKPTLSPRSKVKTVVLSALTAFVVNKVIDLMKGAK